MTQLRLGNACRGFSLVEVVLALGVVSFAVVATVGLLSVASDTNRRARDETFAAQVAANEFARIRSLSANFPTSSYTTRYYDVNLVGLGTTKTADAVYELKIDLVTLPAPAAADMAFNAEVRYPANAAAPNVSRFTTLMNIPKP